MEDWTRSKIISVKRGKIDKLSIATTEGFSLIETKNILYLESDNTYTYFFLESGEKIVATRNLGFFENELLFEPFLRVHNSFVVNLNKVVKYIRADDGYVVLTSGKLISVSRSKRDELLKFFQSRQENSSSKR